VRGFAGLGKLVEDAAGNVYDDGLAEESTTWPSTTPPTSSYDWTGVVSQAIRTWGDVSVADSRARVDAAAVARTPQVYYNPATGRTTALAPGFLGLSANTWLLVAAVVAAILLMRKG
jgi:hypothetical protein